MKQLSIITLILLFSSVIAVITLSTISLFFPLTYSSKNISGEALLNVMKLQQEKNLSPSECAIHYLYYNTDYRETIPNKIVIRDQKLKDGSIVVTFFNPHNADDSVYSSIDKIFLEKTEDNFWKPIRHEWSHKGRGILGWTTKTTI